jgi:hypothetical protein
MAREFPYPPRMMTRPRAAHYVDLSEAEFERLVAGGILPGPVLLGKKPHWNRKDLDEKLDRLLDGGDDWRSTSSFYRKRNAA